MKAKKLFYLLIAVFILSLASCTKKEPEKNTDCGCGKTEIQTVPDTGNN